MAYLTPADLRPNPSVQPLAGLRWPELFVKMEAVGDTALTTLISEASNYIDRRTGDHFATVTYTYDANAAELGLLLVDGPRPNAENEGGKLLFPSKRIQTITSVRVISPMSMTVSTVLPSTGYKVHSSFGYSEWDGIELFGRNPDPSIEYSVGGMSYTWPTWPGAIGLEGTFGWPSTPEPVAKATAYVVCAWAGNKIAPAQAKEWSSGRARITTDDSDSGIPFVEQTVRAYGYGQDSWVEVI